MGIKQQSLTEQVFLDNDGVKIKCDALWTFWGLLRVLDILGVLRILGVSVVPEYQAPDVLSVPRVLESRMGLLHHANFQILTACPYIKYLRQPLRIFFAFFAPLFYLDSNFATLLILSGKIISQIMPLGKRGSYTENIVLVYTQL